VTGHSPGVVRVPTSQVHDTTPVPEAVLGSSPAAWLGPDLYSTSMEHDALGAVCTVAVAGLPCPVAGRLTIRTDRAGAGGWVVGGRVVVGARVVVGRAVVGGTVVVGAMVVWVVGAGAAVAGIVVVVTVVVGAPTTEPTMPKMMNSARTAARMTNHGRRYQGRGG
jgi:hypothetical protein